MLVPPCHRPTRLLLAAPRKKTIPAAIPYLGYVLPSKSGFEAPTKLPAYLTACIYASRSAVSQMSRPSAKLCAECFPGALRSSRALRAAAPLRGAGARERSYVTHQSALSTPTARRDRGLSPALAVQRNASQLPLRSSQRRCLATAGDSASKDAVTEKKSGPPQEGPMKEYDDRVQSGRLRDDPYQRGRWNCN